MSRLSFGFKAEPGFRTAAWQFVSRRSALWVLLLALLVALLGTLIWLAGRYEASRVQSRLDRDGAETLADIRSG